MGYQYNLSIYLQCGILQIVWYTSIFDEFKIAILKYIIYPSRFLANKAAIY